MTNQLAMIALDKKLDCFRWAQTPVGKMYANDLCKLNGVSNFEIGEHIISAATGLGETFVLTSELADVVNEASKTMPNYTLLKHDLPSKHGFLYLENPLVFLDVKNNPVVVRAIGWVTMSHAENDAHSVGFIAWTDISDNRDAESKSLLAIIAHDNPLKLDVSMVTMLAGMWELGKDLVEHHFIYPFILAFYRFIQEPYVSKTEAFVGKPAIKRAKRAGQNPTVTVVKLRKRPSVHVPSDVTNPVEWKNRWVVGPFWRNQYYPSLGVHRPKYIMAYIKGPEDKPLVVKSKVNVVDR